MDEAMRIDLIKTVSMEETKKALGDMGSFKASGPEGTKWCSSRITEHCWESCGPLCKNDN